MGKCKREEPSYQHVHPYCTQTSVEDCHRHGMQGYTAPASYGPCHTHKYEGETTCNDGHTHYFHGETGPAITVPGGHIHELYGKTSKNHGHRHKYDTQTDRERRVC